MPGTAELSTPTGPGRCPALRSRVPLYLRCSQSSNHSTQLCSNISTDDRNCKEVPRASRISSENAQSQAAAAHAPLNHMLLQAAQV